MRSHLVVCIPHDRPYYKTDIVFARPVDGSGGNTSKIQIAVSEEAPGELTDASGKPDWTQALATARAVFQVPGETKLAILERNAVGWSLDHPGHAGVALKVRVLDSEHSGQIGYVLAAGLLNFLEALTISRKKDASLPGPICPRTADPNRESSRTP
jgi:hypothetical protein